MSRHFALLLLSIGGCGGGGEAARPLAMRPPIDRFIGELHLHQFPLGGHAWTAFLAEPVPKSRVHSDQLDDLELPPTRREGSCALYVEPTCQPNCSGMTYCTATNTCTPFSQLHYVDGGEVDVRGSHLWPLIRMWFDGPTSTYLADPKPGSDRLFAGGELLRVSGGKGPDALTGELPAPKDVVVTTPDLTRPLHLPPDAPFEVAWVAEGAESIVATLSASAGEGQSAYIRCVTADVGRLTVPQSMMAALPPPPRDLRIEVERDEQRILPTAVDGVGVLAHAAQSSWENGSE